MGEDQGESENKDSRYPNLTSSIKEGSWINALENNEFISKDDDDLWP